jgi:hypothetical protein
MEIKEKCKKMDDRKVKERNSKGNKRYKISR